MPLLWLYLLIITQRFLELALCRKNRRWMLAMGGHEVAPESYRRMVLLHLLFYLGLLLEPHPWQVPLEPWRVALLGGFFLVQVLRYWTILSLGKFWNTRIMIIPGSSVIRRGPYRWLRHPNYLVITLEFIILPLLMEAPWTLLFCTLGNLLVLRERIYLEEQALRQATDYDRKFGRQP